MKPRSTHEKRRKEQARQERQRDKAEKRLQRKQGKVDDPDGEGGDGDGLELVDADADQPTLSVVNPGSLITNVGNPGAVNPSSDSASSMHRPLGDGSLT